MIDPADLIVDVIRTQHPGGQHAGTPLPIVRIIHEPTGLFAQCGYERSQYKNREIALQMLEYGLILLNIDYKQGQ